MEWVMQIERGQGIEPKNVCSESRIRYREPLSADWLPKVFRSERPRQRSLAHTVTKNEFLTGLNRPDAYILVIVIVEGREAHPDRLLTEPLAPAMDLSTAISHYVLSACIHELFGLCSGSNQLRARSSSSGKMICRRSSPAKNASNEGCKIHCALRFKIPTS